MKTEKNGCSACFNLKLKSPCSKSTKSTTTRGHEEASGIKNVTSRTTTNDLFEALL
jgi:hypothetical protein